MILKIIIIIIVIVLYYNNYNVIVIIIIIIIINRLKLHLKGSKDIPTINNTNSIKPLGISRTIFIGYSQLLSISRKKTVKEPIKFTDSQ